MLPPPIRYPLPTLAGLILASAVAWQGMALTHAWRAAVADRVRLAVEGPPVPESKAPKIVLGPIVARALLLRDGVPTAARPGGPATGAIDRRMFVDIYDRWPDDAHPTHLRVGNRRAAGWIDAGDALAWNSRLVVRAERGSLELRDRPDSAKAERVDVGPGSLPVLGWSGDSVEVAVWEPDGAWSKVRRTGWARLAELPPRDWGVWIGTVEVPILFRLAQNGDPAVARLRALLGRLADARAYTAADVEAARPGLPAFATDGVKAPGVAAAGLAEFNARDDAEAAWSGIAFRPLPLADLP